MSDNKINIRASRRKTQSTPTTRLVRDRETAPARTYVIGPAGWLIVGIMALMVIVAIARAVSMRGAM